MGEKRKYNWGKIPEPIHNIGGICKYQPFLQYLNTQFIANRFDFTIYFPISVRWPHWCQCSYVTFFVVFQAPEKGLSLRKERKREKKKEKKEFNSNSRFGF